MQSLVWRGVLVLEQRRIRKAEIELGVLGWQQADYFSPEIESQVKQLHDVESRQAELLNREAEIVEKILALEARRAQARAALEKALARIVTEREPALQARAQARAAEETADRFGSALAELDTEIERVSDQRRLALRLERQALERTRAEKFKDVARFRQALAPAEERIGALDRQERKLAADFDADDALIAEQIRLAGIEKKRTREQMDALEIHKHSPYLHIGRCLADCEIAPRNQPGALRHVLDFRLRARRIEESMERLHRQNERRD